MKRVTFLLAALCMAISGLAQSQSSSMLSTIKSFYTSNYSSPLPCTKRFSFYNAYCTDYDVFSMSQDPDTPRNVKVVERSDIKNAYEVNFTQFGQPFRLIIKCLKEDGIWKVDNIIYPKDGNQPLFNYTGKFGTCYGLDCYPISRILNDFIWSISINGEKQILQFDVTDYGAISGTGYIQRSSPAQNLRVYRGSVKSSDDGNFTCTLQEYVQGTYVRKCSIHFTDDWQYLVMESNGKTYRMSIVEPYIR